MQRDTSYSTPFLPTLFSITLFASAYLLFWIQPLIAKTLLPLLGGSPAVWNTCLLFFQSTLLVGYVYALLSNRMLSLRAQAAVHISLLVIVATWLVISPIHTPVAIDIEHQNPSRWLLKNLLVSVGLPLFTISATNPLLQSWFSTLRHRLSADPYFLFAASNAGSLIALVAFPLLLEPALDLNHQFRLWHIGCAILLALMFAVAIRQLTSPGNDYTRSAAVRETDNRLTVLRRFRWLALSFVPSSLMLGVTTYITTDVAAVPLLWVIPLALYLITFVLAFSKKQFASPPVLNRVVIVGALVVTLILATGATEPVWVLVLANLAFFFVAALMCHTQLAMDRPTVAHLPEYYLWIAIGGALGSFFNVLIAPILFKSVVEYPLALVFACMLLSKDTEDRDEGFKQKPFDVIYPLGLYFLTLGLALVVARYHLTSSIARAFIILGIPLIILNHFFRNRPMRLALGLSAVLLASIYYNDDTARTIHVVRNFFGTTRVTTDAVSRIHTLYSGNTVHGSQFVDPSRQCEPLSYHHENGPLGQVMAVYNAAPANSRVAVIGLGVGAMAAYSKPDQEWTFYEINPDVIQIARDPQYFSYLQNCSKGSLNVILGDARLNIANAQPAYYGLIVLDAFSSDAIPVHLVTQQALDLYLSKLASGGMLAFHISNRSLNLKPILADLASSRGLVAISFDDLKPSSIEGKDPSQWLVMARSEQEVSYLSINSQWQRLKGREGARVWSDDFSNIVTAIRWR